MQVKAEYTNVPVQTDVRQSQQKQDAKREKPAETTNTHKPNKIKTRPRQQNNPKPRRRGSHKHQPGQRQQGGQTRPNRARARGEEGKRGLANKEREDAREGSRGRREKAAQAKKACACSFSDVLRRFWITRGRIPQYRSEGHINNTHNMVERAKPHTGPKPLLPRSEGKTGANQPRHAMQKV